MGKTVSRPYSDVRIRVAMTSTTKNQVDRIMKHYKMTSIDQLITALIKREAIRLP